MHSNGRSAHEFDPLATALADRFTIMSWDMPGQGDSDRLTRHFQVADYVAILLEVVDALCSAPPIIAGSSIGAVFALAAAAEHPDRFAGCIPIELPMTRDGGWWADHWPMVERMFAVPDETPEQVAGRFRAVPADLALRLRMDRHKAGGWTMIDVLWAGRDDADATLDRIRSLRVPTLFLNGIRGVAPDAALLLPTLNPRVQLEIIGDSGHFPQTDDPTATAAAILRHFGG